MTRVLFAILCIGAGIYLLQVHVQPGLLEIEDLRREQEIVTDTIDQTREVIRLRDEKLGVYNSIAPTDIEKIRKFLPAGSELSKFLIDIDTLVTEADMTMHGITFKERVESSDSQSNNAQSGVQLLSVTADVEGTYENFRELLTFIERNLRLMDIVHIGLQEQAEKKGLMRFQIVINAYYQERAIL